MSERVTVIGICKPNCAPIQVLTKARARDILTAIEAALEAKRGLWLTNASGHETHLPVESLQNVVEVSEQEMTSQTEQQQAIAKQVLEQAQRQALAGGGPGMPIPLVQRRG
jgi:hypothetical protein